MVMTKCQQVTSIIFGVFEIILGIILVVLAFVFASYGNVDVRYTPYWVGFPYLLPGILMIVAGAAKNNGCMIAAMVCNILLTILSVVPAGILAVAWAETKFATPICSTTTGPSDPDDPYNTQYTSVSCSDDLGTLVAVLAIVSITCAVLALASSILGCAATCCCPQEQPVMFIAQPNQPGVFVSTNTVSSSGVPLGHFPGYGQENLGAYVSTHDKASLVV